MNPGPVSYMLHKPFLAAMAEEIRESFGLCRLLVADDNRLIASSLDLVRPASMPSDLAGQVRGEIAHEVGELAGVGHSK
jgi:hypothetical protein